VPLYEYHCRKCDATFEVRQKFTDETLTSHEDCGGEVERLISVPSFQFKGSGWYVTDYGKGGKKPSAEGGGNSKSKDSGGDKSDSGSKSESKTESPKTESKTESKPTPVKSSSE
jgi:putative FmdB family regulatory protein